MAVVEEVVGAEGDDGLAHLCVVVFWAVNSLARCVPAVSEVVRAQRGVRLCAASYAASRKLSGGGNDRRPVPFGSCFSALCQLI